MNQLRRALRSLFAPAERALDATFSPAWNPLFHLGALGFFFYWIVAVSGIYLYIFFDTGIPEAYDSVEAITHEQWFLGGVMRSLHRYASDALVLVAVVHVAREFSLDRYRGPKWFTWITGVPIFGLVIASGITGYWLIWDRLAQYVAVVTSEWLDWFPIFGEPIARNFISNSTLDDRFFTLVIFMHIALPLFLLLVLWIHLQRVSRPVINPPRGLAAGSFVAMLVLSLIKPATSQGPADLGSVASVVGLDWFYLGLYPLLDYWSAGAVWGVVAVLALMFAVLPWMPPMRRVPPAIVDLGNCNGCARCSADCPYAAISMEPRTDGRPYQRQAQVNTSLCESCGICAGSCPTSTPFRRGSELIPGIDLPHYPLRELREKIETAGAGLSGDVRVLILRCGHSPDAETVQGSNITAINIQCAGMLPPSFIDFVLSRDLADGVLIVGCRGTDCYYRLGAKWTERRLEGVRDPHLRRRVPRERIARLWAGAGDRRQLADSVAEFLKRLGSLPHEHEGDTVRKFAVGDGSGDG